MAGCSQGVPQQVEDRHAMQRALYGGAFTEREGMKNVSGKTSLWGQELQKRRGRERGARAACLFRGMWWEREREWEEFVS